MITNIYTPIPQYLYSCYVYLYVNKLGDTKMKFWQNNRLDQEHEKHPSDILDEFIVDKEYKLWQEGYPLDRCLRAFLVEHYGSFENPDYLKLFEYIRKNALDRIKKIAILGMVQ